MCRVAPESSTRTLVVLALRRSVRFVRVEHRADAPHHPRQRPQRVPPQSHPVKRGDDVVPRVVVVAVRGVPPAVRRFDRRRSRVPLTEVRQHDVLRAGRARDRQRLRGRAVPLLHRVRSQRVLERRLVDHDVHAARGGGEPFGRPAVA
eukprot:31422-Pelagococcus_subviridis.AAC.18